LSKWRSIAAPIRDRQARLAADQEKYRRECAERQADVDDHNARLDAFITAYKAGNVDAVQEYIGMVVDNSVYPDPIVGVTDYSYDPLAKELTLQAQLQRPDEIPSEREYRYVKSKDEITATSQTLKQQHERYASIVNSVALRTVHDSPTCPRLS